MGDDMIDRAVPLAYFLRGENENIEGARHRFEQELERYGAPMAGKRGAHDYQEVEVAVRGGVAAGVGTEEDDPLR